MDKIDRLISHYRWAEECREKYASDVILEWHYGSLMEAYADAISIITGEPFPAITDTGAA